MDFEKINIEKLRKLLGDYWLNVVYEKKQYYSEKEKDEIVLAERTQLKYAHSVVQELFDNRDVKRRKYFKLFFSNRYSYKEILVPKACLYCVEEMESRHNYKKIHIKIDEFVDLVIEQTSLPVEMIRI